MQRTPWFVTLAASASAANLPAILSGNGWMAINQSRPHG